MNSTTQSFQAPSASAITARRLIPSLACCGVLALFAGCATEPESHIVSAPPPPTPSKQITTTTTTTSAPTAVQTPVYVSNAGYTTTQTVPVNTIVVTQAPPTLQQEVVLARPTSRHVWLPGFWTWQNDRYEWMAGHWELPPSSTAVWVAPRWEQQGNAYKFSEGYWN